MSTLGIIVNPLAGRDVRRLVAHASPSTDRVKVDTVRRAVLAAVGAGAERVLLSPDHRGLAAAGVAGLDLDADVEALNLRATGERVDTTAAAAALHAAGADVLLTLGGDGTHRDVALGWRDAPLVPISTGTNNAYPLLVDATVAGSAAGLIAAGLVQLDEVAATSKLLEVDLGYETTLALVDAVLVDGRFTGSRAIWDPQTLRTIVAALADPAALGLSSVAGRAMQALPSDDYGVIVECSPTAQSTVQAPILPGAPSRVGVTSWAPLALDAETEITGPGLLALDGERHAVVNANETVSIRLTRAGPELVDPWTAVRLASARGAFGPRN